MEPKRMQTRLKFKMRRYFELAKITRHLEMASKTNDVFNSWRWSSVTAAEPPWKFKIAAAEPPWNEKCGFSSG